MQRGSAKGSILSPVEHTPSFDPFLTANKKIHAKGFYFFFRVSPTQLKYFETTYRCCVIKNTTYLLRHPRASIAKCNVSSLEKEAG